MIAARQNIMEKPSYFLSRPALNLDPLKTAAFESLWKSTPSGCLVDYHLPYPKWEFLTYLCDTKELVLHGSQDQEIATVEPRQAHDKRAFSSQQAIYATTDGIWVIYFAIIDRQRFRELSLFNSCLQVCSAPGQLSEPLYFFSITQSVKVKQPWCPGDDLYPTSQAFLPGGIPSYFGCRSHLPALDQ